MRRPRSVALLLLVALALLVATSWQRTAVQAQGTPPPSFVPMHSVAVGFAVSPPLSELPPEAEVKPEDILSDAEAKSRPMKIFRTETESEPTADGAVMEEVPAPEVIPGPGLSFEGLNSQDNANLFGFRLSPPDTDGDVGPNHYVQMINLVWRVFDKAGNPLTPPRKLSSIWAPLGAPCGTADDGDPVVLYDPLADRWLLSQFCVAATPNNHQLFAISQTPDPTGAYYLYDFMMPNNKFNDYPKIGVWPDAYYMTDNQFNQAGTAFLGGGVFAFDRAKMLLGDPTAGFVYFDTCPTNGGCIIGGMLPVDLDGLAAPPAGTPGYFAYFTANEFGDPSDAMRLFDFHVDWANPAASTFAERPESPVAVAAFDPRSPAGRDDVEQPPPATSAAFLDSIQDRLMFRLAYRNFGSYESMVVTHTVNVGTGTTAATHQSGIRYYEFRRALPGGGFTVAEQATFSPDTDNRWMGAAAMDNNGNLAVGYSVSSLTTFPSIRYAGRLASDPPGGLFQGETSLIAGSGVQRDSGSRWGDYSGMSVDPANDCDFWYTQEYYTAASQASSTVGWLTRIGRFTFPTCTPGAKGYLNGTVTDAISALPIAGAAVQTDAGHLQGTSGAGGYAFITAPGTFNMTASKFGYLPATATAAVTNGATTVQDFALMPVPVAISGGPATFESEDCAPATGVADPAETVSFSFPVKNIGALATTDLVATLQATGGVTSPSAPQSYGVLLPGGPAVSRSFTFTVDSGQACGSTIVASLDLQDGATNLGTLTYTIQLGALGAPTLTTYSTGNLATPIPDLASVDIPIAVPDLGEVADVNVGVRLNHTFDGDLLISLVHPDGTVINLSNRRGGSGDNFGSGANDCSGTHTVFDDSAATAVASGTAPFAGSFRPDQALSGLNGKPTTGTWNLRVADQASLDVGTVGCVNLTINRQQYLCCPFTGGAPAMAAVPPATVTAESCGAGNGAPDPDETVTVSFPLRNVGTGPTVDLVATLLPGGGVNAPSGPQSYGALSPVGPAEARTFTFVPSGTCGGTLTATLSLEDVGGAGSLGTVSFTMTLGGTQTGVSTFSNPGALTIPATGTGASTGAPASPYPSSITVSGITGTVGKVTATLNGLSHTFPSDLDILLVGPGGQRLLLISDVGGGTDIVNGTVTLDDSGPAVGATLVSGTFRPSNSGTGDLFPAPAPAGPYPDPQLLSVFNGVNPNGTWNLFVVDDAGVDVGSLAGGWTLTITTQDPLCCSEACVLTCPDPVSADNDPGLCSAAVEFGDTTVSGSCGVVTTAPASGSTFPVGSTDVTSTAVSTADGSTLGTCTFAVTVNDVEDPTLSASLSPSMLWPPNHHPVDISATVTAADNCGVTGTSLDGCASNEDDDANGNGDGNTTGDVSGVDGGSPADTEFSLRAERGGHGQGRVYTCTYSATDAAGNTVLEDTGVLVPHDQGGVTDPLVLAVLDGATGTRVSWNDVPRASTYHLIRGNLGSISEESAYISLGAVTCLSSGPATSIDGSEDSAVPEPDQVFFYLVAYDDGVNSSYGTVSASKPRVTLSGNCE